MAFQILDFVSISASAVNYCKAVQSKLTDFSVGSAARTILDACAAIVDELYQQMWLGLKEAIPQAVYSSFDFARHDATQATGTIRVTVTSSGSVTLVPAATVFTPTGFPVKFKSIEDRSIAIGDTYVDIPVVALTAGVAGNLPAGTPFSLAPSPAGFLSSSSLAEFTTGRDGEDDDQRKVRFGAYISTISRGTVAAIKYGLSTVSLLDSSGFVAERVVSASVIEPWLTDSSQPPGLVNVYIHNGATGASAELLAAATRVIDGYYDASGTPVPGWKAAGAKVVIAAASSVTVNVTGVVTVHANYSSSVVRDEVQSEIANYVSSLAIGDDALLSEIVSVSMGVSGVANIVLSAPTGDTAVSASQKAMVGTIALT